MRALVVDDDNESRIELENILSNYFHCDTAPDGEVGLDLFIQSLDQSNPYHLICLDIIMPKMDGFTVLRNIRGKENELGKDKDERTKIIMVSSLNSSESISGSFNEGCDAYLVKPVQPDNILNRIRDFGLIN